MSSEHVSGSLLFVEADREQEPGFHGNDLIAHEKCNSMAFFGAAQACDVLLLLLAKGVMNAAKRALPRLLFFSVTGWLDDRDHQTTNATRHRPYIQTHILLASLLTC